MAWASVARAVRTPSQLEHDLTITFIEIAGTPIFVLEPNPEFDSEELIAYEAGYRQQLTPDLSLDLAAFYNDYDKLSATSVIAGGFPITVSITNGSTAETYGGEAVLSWRASDKLHLSGSYSFLDMQIHGPAGAVDPEVAEGQSPHHQFNARSQWNIRSDLSLNTALYFIESLPDLSVKHYWRLDMGLEWKVAPNLKLDLVGQNLFSPPRREFTAPDDAFTPAARISPSAYGKLTWTF
jgi:iron complex outermembrane recepter protein